MLSNTAMLSRYRSAPLLAAIMLSCLTLTFYVRTVHGSGPGEQKAQGAALFAEKGCAHCHGASGFGGSDTGPDLSHVRKELKPAEIAQQIHDGGNNMPPFSDALTNDEITSLVTYLRSKRNPPPGWVRKPPSAAAPRPAASSDPE